MIAQIAAVQERLEPGFEGPLAAGDAAALGAFRSTGKAGLPIDEITETIKPVIAQKDFDGIPAGGVLGLHQVALVQAGDEPKVVLDLKMAVGAPDPADRIDIEGDPPLHLVAAGGFHGDRSTIGTVVNAIPFIVSAAPGLHNVVTLPLFGLRPLI